MKFFVLALFFIQAFVHAQWVQTSGPYSGKINYLLTNSNLIFAGSNDSGIYRSTNNGNNWIAKNTGLTSKYITSICLSGTELFCSNTNGIFSSTDNGESWVARNSGLTSLSTVRTIAVKNSTLFAGTYGSGIYISTNNGVKWTASNTGLTNKYISAIGITDSIILAGTDAGVFLSTDNGNNWSASNTGLPAGTDVKTFLIANSCIYVGSLDGVFRSTDGGRNWSSAFSGILTKYIYALVSYGSVVFAGTNGGIYFSANNGASWTLANSGFTTSPSIYSLTIYNGTLFAGTGNSGVWKRTLQEFVALDRNTVHGTSNFSLRQNYPNPFNPVTSIQYSLPENSEVVLNVYNLMGEKVKTLVNGFQIANTYTISFDASNLPSGLYIYSLKAGKYSVTKKMTVLK